MLFWIVSAVITVAAALVLIGPLFRGRDAVSERESEIAIYRDQLSEIERDVDRGVLPAAEAESARTEIARRLLRASEAKDGATGGNPGRRRAAMWVAIIAMPVISLSGYLAFGEPGARDLPIKERLANPQEDDLFARFDALGLAPTAEEIAALSDPVEAALEQQPDNPTLLNMATITRFQSGRLNEATDAYLRLLDAVANPGRADEDGEFGTTLGVIQLSQAEISDEGARLVRRVAADFPFNGVAMVNLAQLLALEGDTGGAIAVLQDLIENEAPGGDPWSGIVRDFLAELGVDTPPIAEAAPVAPPSIGEMTPEQQLALIEDMVSQLAAGLEADPNNPEGWARLITSYIVLERNDDALAALERAREVFTGNEEALRSIEEAAGPLTE